MMHTHNETLVEAPVKACLQVATDVERWPEILPHYRRVRFERRDGPGRGRVFMSAFRHFGPLPYPTWWVSEMATDFDRAEIRYRHVEGITTGMDVLWSLTGRVRGTRIVITHDWEGPAWPLVGTFAAEQIIGPHFIEVVADRTLAGVASEAERRREAGA